MKFGIREVTDITFKAKSSVYIGSRLFVPGQTVLAIDSAKTSTLEGAATTVYATGGRGNTRLIAWEGEKTLTFTLEDALISPMGISILTGAGLINNTNSENKVHIHRTFLNIVEQDTTAEPTKYFVNLTDALDEDETICQDAPLFALIAENDGSLTGEMLKIDTISNKKVYLKNEKDEAKKALGRAVVIDCYTLKNEASVYEVQIDAANFAGYYYVEGETYFRKQETGKDMPAYLTIPNVKIQSNFTFTMSPAGDPSTFTFTMDAFPGYTYFNKTKKVLCVIQIVDETKAPKPDMQSVMTHSDTEGQISPDKEDKDSLSSRTTPIFGTDIIFVDGTDSSTKLTKTDCTWDEGTRTLTFEKTSSKKVKVIVDPNSSFASNGALSGDGVTEAITPSETREFCGTTFTPTGLEPIDYTWTVIKKKS